MVINFISLGHSILKQTNSKHELNNSSSTHNHVQLIMYNNLIYTLYMDVNLSNLAIFKAVLNSGTPRPSAGGVWLALAFHHSAIFCTQNTCKGGGGRGEWAPSRRSANALHTVNVFGLGFLALTFTLIFFKHFINGKLK